MSAAHELIPAVLDDLELTWEPGVHAQEWVVTLPGEKKLKTVVSLQISGGALLTRAFVIRNPDENHAAFYRYLLMSTSLVAFPSRRWTRPTSTNSWGWSWRRRTRRSTNCWCWAS